MFKSIIHLIIGSIFLIVFVTGCDEDNPVESEEVHFEAIGVIVLSNGDTVASYQDLVVNGSINVIANDTTEILSIQFVEEDGDIGIPPSDDWTLDWSIDDISRADVVASDSEISSYQIHIYGKVAGQTNIRFIINHHGHKDYESADIPIIIEAR
jgi:hypothetical protein